jgi:hypothetical protein
VSEKARARDCGRRGWAAGPWLVSRLATAVYLAFFLVASSAAPHRHGNPVEDLFDDGPSDSGIVFDAATQSRVSAPFFCALRVVDDDSCPACFSSDFAAGTAPAISRLAAPASRLDRRGPRRSPHVPISVRFASSRAPPSRGF